MQTGPVEPCIMELVKNTPYEIRNQDGLYPSSIKIFCLEWLMDVQIVKQAKGRNKEKDWNREPRKDFEQGNKMQIRLRISQILGSDMNADDSHHGNPANIFNGWKPGLSFFYSGYSFCHISHQ